MPDTRNLYESDEAEKIEDPPNEGILSQSSEISHISSFKMSRTPKVEEINSEVCN